VIELLLSKRTSGKIAIIDDLLSWAKSGRQEAVDQAIIMLSDLCKNGHTSTYLKKLHNSPISELKTHARGGTKGGVRVYLYWRPSEIAVICGGEIKEDDRAGRPLLEAVRFFNADDTT
jgi:hypothetical protein